ncbi:DUF1501 domain-containing protein [Inhella gelatinilytica]|uniref:DUF1501 domain-containing protein n=1 Tax=Inhella gelatinilytica TaxID=2795030 RepID=A0A931IW20_9BURK|nr:DUF1501 domain-containing protein [Inhella gelatinilytica]MBH9552059.1 DUF1501 domain-containing protein [Inhella gelatinilytica]
MNRRREFLGGLGLAGLGAWSSGLLGSSVPLLQPAQAAGDYRALVVIFLDGGNDGNNVLVPTDGGYTDYAQSRQHLAFAKDSLAGLVGMHGGRSLAVHPALAPLAGLFESERLNFIANVGPLVEPSTAQKVLDLAVEVPPFLLSHSEQVSITQGWTWSDDSSGWAGRGLELLPSSLRNNIAAVTLNRNRQLVQGKRSSVSYLEPDGSRYWHWADMARPADESVQELSRMAQWQFSNPYEAEYARTFGQGVEDAKRFTSAIQGAAEPAADFGDGGDNYSIGGYLRLLAKLMPVFRSQGLRRQVFMVQWGGFDTHTGQRGSGSNTQDTQLAALARAMKAFDDSNRAAGLDSNVVTLVMSEFGRTLRPGSGGGSEHGWGSHWWTMGGPVQGRQVVGTFPQLVLGGVDDGDRGQNGRLVPGIATDQVAATLMQWMGLPQSLFSEAFPLLGAFSQKILPLLKV